MTIDSHAPSSKLLWIDMEMTGLDPKTDRILEVAAIITDFDFKELYEYESVIYQPPEVLQNMNQWATETHTVSGLIDRVQAAPNEKHVELEVIEMIKTYFKEPAVLAGNSIHQDRQFIRAWWPEAEKLLHYRMVDVSSYKVIMQNRYNLIFNKKETHRALDDIKESIAELKFYLDYWQKSDPSKR